MANGHIDSEDTLREVIERVSTFDGYCEAFIFFTNSVPHEWSEFDIPEFLGAHDNDLGAVALAITNQVVTEAVFDAISQTEGYRLLTEGRHTKRLRWTIEDTEHVFTLREIWKARAALYVQLTPTQIRQHHGTSVAVYKRDEGEEGHSYTVLMEHDDPTLIWKSKRYYVEKETAEQTVEYYEEQKVERLLHWGCPSDQFWLTEVQTVDQFNEHFCSETEVDEDYYGLNDFDFVVYYHESGEVHCHAGFNDEEEFDSACQTIAEYLK